MSKSICEPYETYMCPVLVNKRAVNGTYMAPMGPGYGANICLPIWGPYGSTSPLYGLPIQDPYKYPFEATWVLETLLTGVWGGC